MSKFTSLILLFILLTLLVVVACFKIQFNAEISSTQRGEGELLQVQSSSKECAKFNLCFPSGFFSCSKYITYRNSKETCILDWLHDVKTFIANNPQHRRVAASVLISSLDKVDNIQTCDGVLYVRNELIDVLAETGDPRAVELLTKEVAHPRDAVFSFGASGCRAEKAASLMAATLALLKLGKGLDELPIDWEGMFSNKPEHAIGLITEALTSDRRFDTWKNLRIEDQKIINSLISVMETCQSEDCIFYIAPLLTHTTKNQEVVSVMEDILKERSDKLSWSTKYVLEKSLEALKENEIFCISSNLRDLFLFEKDVIPPQLSRIFIGDYRHIGAAKEKERKRLRKIIEDNADNSKCFRIGIMGGGFLHYDYRS